jgi:hypothetical protein
MQPDVASHAHPSAHSPENHRHARPPEGAVDALNRLITGLPRIFVPVFALMFFALSVCFMLLALAEFAVPILEDGDFMEGLVKGLHTGVVALAVYELAQIVHQEYDHEGKPQNIMARIRRGVARFGSVVIVALVLESLILVIKYSQKDLAGFLFYPAAIIVSAAVLLMALGLFARLTAVPVRATKA